MSYGLKYKRPTRKEEGHTNIIVDGKVIGYFMPDRGPFRGVNDNWWLHSSELGYFSFSSRKKLIAYLDMRIRKERIRDKGKLFHCYDCGSTIEGHHTESCELAEDTDVRDLPQIEGTQYWTESVDPSQVQSILELARKIKKERDTL